MWRWSQTCLLMTFLEPLCRYAYACVRMQMHVVTRHKRQRASSRGCYFSNCHFVYDRPWKKLSPTQWLQQTTWLALTVIKCTQFPMKPWSKHWPSITDSSNFSIEPSYSSFLVTARSATATIVPLTCTHGTNLIVRAASSTYKKFLRCSVLNECTMRFLLILLPISAGFLSQHKMWFMCLYSII